LVTLKSYDFKNIKIDKKMEDKKKLRHYGFLIARKLFHEIMGHKKSLISKFGTNFISPISFKNKGALKFITELNNELQYNNLKDVINEGISLIDCCGDSGYLLEYYFGQINDYSITSIIDYIKDLSNLNVLLNSKLWHFDIEKFKDYVYYKYLSLEYKISVNEELNLDQQIKYLEYELYKKIGCLKEDNENKDQRKDDDHNQTNEKKSHKGKKNYYLLNKDFFKKNPKLKKIENPNKEKIESLKKEKKIKYSFFSDHVYRK
jgi:hypothetical protein